jgi:hypothetical protein
MRFRQLHSLCHDLRLGKEELVNGD